MSTDISQQHAHRRAARVKAAFKLARVALGLGLLAVLIVWKGPHQMGHRLLDASMPQLAGALALYLAATLLIAWRWQMVLKARGVSVGLVWLTRSYLVAFFFNNFIPSSVGGDVVRVIGLTRRGCPAALSFGSVFVERLIGFLAMTVLALGSLFYLASEVMGKPLLLAGTAALAGCFVLVTVVCFSRRAGRLMTAALSRLRWRRAGTFFQNIYDAVHSFRAHMGVLGAVFLVSLVYQVVMGVFTYWVMRATGVHAPFLNIFALIQVSCMVGVLPITFDGMGVREGIFVYALGAVGFAREAVLPAIIMARIVSLAGSLVGGLIFLCGERHSAPVEKPS